jgi:hypothetical protein
MDHNELLAQAARYENRIAELEADVNRETHHRYLVESDLAHAGKRIAELTNECARLAKRESELMYDLFMAEAKALNDKARLDWLELNLREVRRLDPWPTMDCQPVLFRVWTPAKGAANFLTLREAIDAAMAKEGSK